MNLTRLTCHVVLCLLYKTTANSERYFFRHTVRNTNVISQGFSLSRCRGREHDTYIFFFRHHNGISHCFCLYFRNIFLKSLLRSSCFPPVCVKWAGLVLFQEPFLLHNMCPFVFLHEKFLWRQSRSFSGTIFVIKDSRIFVSLR